MSKHKDSRDHLALLHECPCVVCWLLGIRLPDCQQIEAHHLESIRDEWSDYAAVPLGKYHHDELHQLHRRGFYNRHKLSDTDLMAGTVALIRQRLA